MEQLLLEFPTKSPININKLKGQNKRLYDYLSTGKTIHCFSDAMRTLRIGYLNSRISDLRNGCSIVIHSRFINVYGTTCNEYSLTEFKTDKNE